MNDAAYEKILRRLGVETVPAKPQGHVPEAARFLAMPLDRFTREGAPLELRVRWLATTLWLTPDPRHAETLVKEGVSRGRIWTAAELKDLFSGPPLSGRSIKSVIMAKLTFEGEVIEVRIPWPEGEEAE